MKLLDVLKVAPTEVRRGELVVEWRVPRDDILIRLRKINQDLEVLPLKITGKWELYWVKQRSVVPSSDLLIHQFTVKGELDSGLINQIQKNLAKNTGQGRERCEDVLKRRMQATIALKHINQKKDIQEFVKDVMQSIDMYAIKNKRHIRMNSRNGT